MEVPIIARKHKWPAVRCFGVALQFGVGEIDYKQLLKQCYVCIGSILSNDEYSLAWEEKGAEKSRRIYDLVGRIGRYTNYKSEKQVVESHFSR